MTILTDPHLLQLVVDGPNNSFEGEKIYFHQYTHGDVISRKVFLLGFEENNPLHKKILSTFLISVVKPEDLVLCEYVDSQEIIAKNGKTTQRDHMVFSIPMLKDLLQEIIPTGATFKGWDKGNLQERIMQMFLKKSSLTSDFIDILFRQRNDELVKSVLAGKDHYRNIYVIAGAAHFCISTLFDDSLKNQLQGEVQEIQQSTFNRLQNTKPIILVPCHNANSMNRLKGAYCLDVALKCFAVALAGVIFLQFSR